MRDEFNNCFQGDQRFGTPIEGDVGKEPMFDLVPFTGSWGEMAYRDAEPGLVGKLLHLALP